MIPAFPRLNPPAHAGGLYGIHTSPERKRRDLYRSPGRICTGGTGTTGPSGTSSSGAKFLEVLMWGTFIVLLMINGYQYFFNVNIFSPANTLFCGFKMIRMHTKLSDTYNFFFLT